MFSVCEAWPAKQLVAHMLPAAYIPSNLSTPARTGASTSWHTHTVAYCWLKPVDRTPSAMTGRREGELDQPLLDGLHFNAHHRHTKDRTWSVVYLLLLVGTLLYGVASALSRWVMTTLARVRQRASCSPLCDRNRSALRVPPCRWPACAPRRELFLAACVRFFAPCELTRALLTEPQCLQARAAGCHHHRQRG